MYVCMYVCMCTCLPAAAAGARSTDRSPATPLARAWGPAVCRSFVYYVECNDDSAETVFYNYGYPYVDHHHYKIKPKKGRCVLFPGAMLHEAMPNKEDTRLVISGNIAFERDK